MDHAVKKSNQIMRLPYSFHKKDDDSDDGYKVKIIYERKQDDKILAFNNDSYDSAMFAYSTKQLIKAFEIDKEIINNIRINKKIRNSDEIRQSNEYKETVKKEAAEAEKSVTFLHDKYSVTKAITEENVNFFIYLQQNSPKEPMTRQQATQYIKSIDMRYILGFNNQPLNAAFSSLFYTDEHPSDNFFINPKTGETSYYCRLDNYVYNDIFNIVYHLLKFNDNMSESSKWNKTFNFVYKMFGLNITANWKKEFEQTISNNLLKFGEIINYSKNTKYLKCAIELYKELMKLWKEHVYQNNIGWRDASRTIAADWISTSIQKDRTTIQKMLLILEYVGLISRTTSKYKYKVLECWKKEPNEYQFTVITDDNINSIIFKAESIRMSMTKPLKEVSRKKLDELFKKVPHKNVRAL